MRELPRHRYVRARSLDFASFLFDSRVG